MPKQLKFNEEARSALLRGANLMASAVKATMGPKGRNVALDRKYGAKTALKWSGQQSAPRLVFAELKGLKPETTYHYRVGAVNATGTSHGDDATFQTATSR